MYMEWNLLNKSRYPRMFSLINGASNGTQLDYLPGGRESGRGRARKPNKGHRRRLSMGSASDKEPLDDAKVLVARGGGGDAPT
jgi:hypothetical protein